MPGLADGVALGAAECEVLGWAAGPDPENPPASAVPPSPTATTAAPTPPSAARLIFR